MKNEEKLTIKGVSFNDEDKFVFFEEGEFLFGGEGERRGCCF